MSTCIWLLVASVTTIVFLNLLFGLWLLDRFDLTDEDALDVGREPNHSLNPTPPTPALPAERHRRFNEVRREAISAALQDFGQTKKTDNPYAMGSPAHATWAGNYERLTRDQMAIADLQTAPAQRQEA